jgi:predicted dehydrogenase
MNVALLGTGLIGTFYCMSLHGLRSRDKVTVVFSRSAERGAKFASDNKISKWTTNLQEAVTDSASGRGCGRFAEQPAQGSHFCRSRCR